MIIYRIEDWRKIGMYSTGTSGFNHDHLRNSPTAPTPYFDSFEGASSITVERWLADNRCIARLGFPSFDAMVNWVLPEHLSEDEIIEALAEMESDGFRVSVYVAEPIFASEKQVIFDKTKAEFIRERSLIALLEYRLMV